MKLIEQSYDILTPISVGGEYELMCIEVAGRTCYKSEDKISADGESAKRFCKMLIDRGHEAMLEHGPSLSVKFICSRGVSHEIVRHRLFSFAQESTRYCNYASGKFDYDCTFILPPDKNWAEENITDTAPGFEWWNAMRLAEMSYDTLIFQGGWSPQEARDVLPNALKTEIVVTGNYREWRHFFKLRCDKAAHPHIRLLATALLKELKEKLPIIFDDIFTEVAKEEEEVEEKEDDLKDLHKELREKLISAATKCRDESKDCYGCPYEGSSDCEDHFRNDTYAYLTIREDQND